MTRAWIACVDLLFDGRPRPGLPQGHVIEGIRIAYAWPKTADDRVVEVVQDLKRDGEESIVVTSDRALAKRTQLLGAKVVSSECLRRALDRIGGSAHLGIPLRSPILESPDALVSLGRA